MLRTRFCSDIVTEFLPPTRPRRKQRVIVLCDGMPSVPRKQPLSKWLSAKGFWVFYPRYRGAWESDGDFLQKSPHEDILDMISELPKGFREPAFGKMFDVEPDEVFVIGGSFGGATALMCSLDKRVTKVVANCPVVDWSLLADYSAETSNPSYAAYIRESFGNGYRLTERNWKKLHSGQFFNPMQHVRDMDPAKIMMFHAKDDPYIPWRMVDRFAKKTGAPVRLLARGGHLKTEWVVQKYWKDISGFFSRIIT